MASELDAFLNKELSSDKRKESKTAQDSGAQGMSLLDVLKTQPEAKFGRGAGIGASRFVENLPFVGEKIATSIPFIKQLAKQEPEDAIGEIGRFAGEEAPAFALANPIVRAAGKLIPTAARLAPSIKSVVEELPASIEAAQNKLLQTLTPAATRAERLLARAGKGAGTAGTATALQSGDEGRADITDVLGSFAGGAALGAAGNVLGGIPGEFIARKASIAKPYQITEAAKNLRNVSKKETSSLYEEALKSPEGNKNSPLANAPAEIPFISGDLQPYLSNKSPVKIAYDKLLRKEKLKAPKPSLLTQIQSGDEVFGVKSLLNRLSGENAPAVEETIPTSFKSANFKDLHELMASINKEIANANRAILKDPGAKHEETLNKLAELKKYADKLHQVRSDTLAANPSEFADKYNEAKTLYKNYVADLPSLSSERITPEKYSTVLSGLSRLEDAPSVQQALRIGLAKANIPAKGYLRSRLFPARLSGDEARIIKGLFKNR